MKILKSIIVSIALVLLVGCKTQNKSVDKTEVSDVKNTIQNTDFNEEKLLEHLQTLSSDAFEGRRTGDEGNAKARAYTMLTQMQNTIFKKRQDYANWLSVMMYKAYPYYEINVVGNESNSLKSKLNNEYLPNIYYKEAITKDDSLSFEFKQVKEKTLIYICQNGSCLLPTENTEEAILKIKGDN